MRTGLRTLLGISRNSVVVPRNDQMPFHTTILGVQYSKVKAIDESDDLCGMTWHRGYQRFISIVNDVDQR